MSISSLVRTLLVVLLSGSAGAAAVQYFMAAPQRANLWLAVTLALLLASMVLAGALFETWGLRLLAGLPLLLGLAAGYVLTTAWATRPPAETPLPALTRGQGEAGAGFTAVIYATHGEPEQYEAAVVPWLHFMQEMQETKAPFVPFLIRPLFFKGLREEYQLTGGSLHNQVHQKMMAATAAVVQSRRSEPLRFYLSFLDDQPHPDAAVIQALNEGASRVIVVNVFLTQSSHTDQVVEMVEALESEKSGAPMCISRPLWDAAALQEAFVVKAEAGRGQTPAEKTGILLVGHGQPEAWDSLFPTQTSQENAFRQALLEQFVRAGYSPENITTAWMDFRSPDVAQALAELSKRPLEKLLVFSAAISAASMHSEYDVPHMVSRAKLPSAIEVVHLGAWNDHPLVIEAIAQRVESCLDEQASVQAK